MIIDLETLGTDPGAVIVSVAAITKDGREFAANVDIDDAMSYGLTIDPKTLRWWLRRYSKHLVSNPQPLRWVLGDLFRMYRGELVWVRGPDFDIPIIEAAAKAAGMNVPWKFWSVRDVRTAAMVAQLDIPTKQHDALQDCRDDMAIIREFDRVCWWRREARTEV